MTKNRTELAFILDRSGSMGGMELDTIGGFNSMLKKQQQEDGECRITTILFDDKYEILHDRADIKAANPITEEEYYVRGSTALLDAVGKTIKKISDAQKSISKEYKADKVLIVITTDGMENASRKYDYSDIKRMIEQQKEKNKWEFIFLGANIDAVEVASHIGIGRDRTQRFHNDSKGIKLNFMVVDSVTSQLRKSSKNETFAEDWNIAIKEDFEGRTGEV